jgi:hypothetical protein
MRREEVYDIAEPERWRKLVQVLGGPGHVRRVPYMSGDLSDDFVPRPAEYADLEARDRTAWNEPLHLSGSAGEIGSPSGPGEGAAGKAKESQLEPQPATPPPSGGRIEPRSRSMGEGAVPTTRHVVMKPGRRPHNHGQGEGTLQTDALIRPVQLFADMPDDDQIKALITALQPASVTHDQPAEAVPV